MWPVILAASAAVMLSPTAAPHNRTSPPQERVARLARGVNLSHWIWLPQEKTAEGRRTFFTEVDARQLATAGFTHVRLPFEPHGAWDEDAHRFRGEALDELRSAARAVLAGGLAVVIDAHPTAETAVRPDRSGGFAEFERLWEALAVELASSDPERVFLEILNEPHDLPGGEDGGSLWPAAQQRLVHAVRAAAPNHTLIVTGEDWGGIDGLLKLQPLADANVVYSFHFYEPMVFTHQGATWGWEPWRHMKDVPYPSTPDSVKHVMDAITDTTATEAVRRYGAEKWGADRVGRRLGLATEWARRHGVTLYCGEFGVNRPVAPRPSRLAWIRDVRSALEQSGVGWAMWDYAGGFNLADGDPGSRQLDVEVLDSLGLIKTEPGAPRPNR